MADDICNGAVESFLSTVEVKRIVYSKQELVERSFSARSFSMSLVDGTECRDLLCDGGISVTEPQGLKEFEPTLVVRNADHPKQYFKRVAEPQQ